MRNSDAIMSQSIRDSSRLLCTHFDSYYHSLPIYFQDTDTITFSDTNFSRLSDLLFHSIHSFGVGLYIRYRRFWFLACALWRSFCFCFAFLALLAYDDAFIGLEGNFAGIFGIASWHLYTPLLLWLFIFLLYDQG